SPAKIGDGGRQAIGPRPIPRQGREGSGTAIEYPQDDRGTGPEGGAELNLSTCCPRVVHVLSAPRGALSPCSSSRIPICVAIVPCAREGERQSRRAGVPKIRERVESYLFPRRQGTMATNSNCAASSIS